jgi:hypothetical protein
MTIWVGYDGTLNDDEGDGPAAMWDPIEMLSEEEDAQGFPYRVGQESGGFDFSSLASAFGGSGGSGGAGGGMDLGQLGGTFGSALGSAFGGTSGAGTGKDVGSAIGDIFGSTAQGAQQGGIGGALGNLAASVVSKAVVPAISSAVSSASKAPPAPPSTSPATTMPVSPRKQGKTQRGVTGPAGRAAGRRQSHAMDPKAKLMLVLGHMAKKYGMTPPPSPSRAAKTAQASDGGTTS